MARQISQIPGPLNLPILGNLLYYKLRIYKVPDYHKVLVHLFQKYGPIVRQTLGSNSTIIHLFDPDDVRKVYMNEGRYPAIEPLQDAIKNYRETNNFSLGLGNTNGEEWHRLRTAVKDKVLIPKQVQNSFPIVCKVTDELIHKLKTKNKVDDLRLLLAKWNREVSGWMCFGKALGCFDGKNGEELAEKIYFANRVSFQMTTKLKFSLPFHNYFETPSWKRLLATENFIYRNVCDEFHKTLKDGSTQSPFFQHIVEQQNLTEKDAIILALSFFLDGLSTTVPTLICNLHCLGQNQQIQQEVYEELKAAVGKNAQEKAVFPVEFLNGLRLLKACVKETFRLYPIGTDVSRILPSDLVLSGFHLPKGTHVNLNQFVHLRSDQYFDKPEIFLPYRWLDNTRKNTHTYLLLPFSHGSRTCAGRRIAEQDLFVSLAKILLNFRLEADGSLEQVYETLLFPKEPLNIRFIPRE